MPLNLAGKTAVLCTFLCVSVSIISSVKAEDPYRFFDWNVTYGFIYPLGVRQQVCPNLLDFIAVSLDL
jgi:hypothetical protein